MQTIDKYDPNQSFCLLLQGPPGAGKTTLACQFPDCYVLDADLNMSGTIRYLKENKRALPLGFDTVDYDDEGKVVEPKLRYQRVAKCLKDVYLDDKIKTVIIDGATKMSDYIIDDILRQNNITQMRVQDWGSYLYMWKNFIGQLRAQRKMVIIICHEKPEKDEGDGMIKYFVALPGQISHIFGGMVSDVWRCYIEEKLVGTTKTYKNMVRTMPNNRFQLKRSLNGLPPEFEMSWDKIATELAKGT